MVHEKQCNICKHYRATSGLCTRKWEQPVFDDSSCEYFVAVQNEASNPVTEKLQEEKTTESTEGQKSFIKRGKSSFHKNIQLSGFHAKYFAKRDFSSTDTKEEFVIEIPEIAVRIAGFLFLVVVLFFAARGVHHYMKNAREEAIEDIVWKARKLIEVDNDSYLINYLRLSDVAYRNRKLTLIYSSNLHNGSTDNMPDSVVYKEFLSVVALSPNRWKEAFRYLGEAKVDLAIVYKNVVHHPTVIFRHEELDQEFLDKEKQQKGLKFFVEQKKEEILNYARIHFKNDPYLKVDEVMVNKDQVTLTLLYNDLEYRMGKSYLDHDQINDHFTDAVGDMGSILDGMWAICSRTGKGIAIIYKGAKRNKTERVEWNAQETRELYKKYGSSIWHNNRRTNQVKTTIVR